MTILELAQRDYKKAKINLIRAKQKPNTTEDEMKHLEELMALRLKIVEKIGGRTK